MSLVSHFNRLSLKQPAFSCSPPPSLAGLDPSATGQLSLLSFGSPRLELRERWPHFKPSVCFAQQAPWHSIIATLYVTTWKISLSHSLSLSRRADGVATVETGCITVDLSRKRLDKFNAVSRESDALGFYSGSLPSLCLTVSLSHRLQSHFDLVSCLKDGNTCRVATFLWPRVARGQALSLCQSLAARGLIATELGSWRRHLWSERCCLFNTLFEPV